MDGNPQAIRVLGVLLLAGFCCLLMFTSIFRPGPSRFPLEDLRAAKDYVAALPASANAPLTSDNQPVTRFVTSEQVGLDALENLRDVRASRYRKAWLQPDIEIIVVSRVFSMPQTERLARLKDLNLRSRTVAYLETASSQTPCLARRYERNGWSEGGFVAVDSASALSSSEEVARCATAGFDYLLGVPAPGEFDLQSFPSPQVGAVLLDYVRQCSDEGETDLRPKLTSGYGVTSYPSIGCIRKSIDAAIDAGESVT